jgi:hypothetical protein
MLCLTPSNGLVVAGADGGVFAYDGAGYFGSLPGLGVTPAEPITGIAVTPTGNGYWLVGEDGGVFAFGDAPFLGSLPGHPDWDAGGPNDPVVGIAAWAGDGTPDNGNGYTVVCHKLGGVPALYQFPGNGQYVKATSLRLVSRTDSNDNADRRVTFDAASVKAG